MFNKICIVGLGLIGSSIARAVKRTHPAVQITGYDASEDVRNRARAIALMPEIPNTIDAALHDADLVILCVPVGAMGAAARDAVPHMKAGAVLSDTGSVKSEVIAAIRPHLRADITFIPAHPIAGTEHSGPEAGFADLFVGRWCILTPLDGTPDAPLTALRELWRGFGSKMEDMPPARHDRTLAITSHLPHLIAYTIVGTATELENDIQSEVIKFSAGGFRDFTRIAASDPTMWRDIFMNNQEAVLEILQRFSEDLSGLQKAIRQGKGDVLFDFFTKTRNVRRAVIEAKQA